ncbi:glycosyltransferase family 25 protein [Rhodobacteraceae bacterium KMM 6894]|nr:glycosyltransferase family 25 protein [Rhodobacteraceae bacterium KMM 6894]
MRMRAYVLHLLRAEARRANARHLLRHCGVAGEIWPAVDGSALPPDELQAHYDTDLFDPHYPFTLRTGEIGCFLSHRQIWADMQHRAEGCALIIEDDAGIDEGILSHSLHLAKKHIQTLGVIQLQTRPLPKGPSQLIDQSGPCQLVVPQVTGLRTTAQVVSKWAAAQLLDRSALFDRPVDTFIQSHWHTGIRPAAIARSGVLEIADRLDGSTIQTAPKPLWEKLWREVARGRYRLAMHRAARHSDAPASGGRQSHD